MNLQFLRGDPDAPKGHAILVARSTQNPRNVFCTYCVVPPIPLSLTKYLPAFLAAQLPPEELQEANSMNVVPIPPMLEEASSFEYLQRLAERRNDDFCDLGSINPLDEGQRMQLVIEGCQEYGRLYFSYFLEWRDAEEEGYAPAGEETTPLDDLDTEDLLAQTMTERERLAELGKLIGTARYALEGHDTQLLQETRRKMQQIAARLADKYKSQELIAAATDSSDRGSKLAQLYLERGFKLLDEEYADIPRIERAIRELQNQRQ